MAADAHFLCFDAGALSVCICITIEEYFATAAWPVSDYKILSVVTQIYIL